MHEAVALVIKVVPERGPALHHRVLGPLISIGRDDACDLVVDADDVSRRHLELRHEEGAWRVCDLGSRNGTRLNGRVIDTEPLRDGDEIRVGRTVLLVQFEPSRRRTARETANPPAAISAVTGSFVGSSTAMATLRRLLSLHAGGDASVLLRGEPGTGKELAARLLHERSARRGGPFVVVNCPAIPVELFTSELFGIVGGTATGVVQRQGLAQAADGGTLFLDEIGDLPLAVQPRVLRFLESRLVCPVGGREESVVDVRVVAATNRDIESAAARGDFRVDLLDRLRMGTLNLPPLREHREDIGELIEHFLVQARPRPSGISSAARAELEQRPLTGNVRELRETLLHAAALAAGGEIDAEHLPAAPQAAPVGLGEELRERLLRGTASFWDDVRVPFLQRTLSREVARALVAQLHSESGGSYKEMARRLGIEREHKKLLNFLRDHRLRPDDH